MKQTERLLSIVNLLRNRRTVLTAQALAEHLNVSVRTIYRDIQKLEAAGIPVEGEAGVGYRVRRRFDLPPLMFDSDELEALILGVKMVRAWSDHALAASANAAMNKIVGALPSELKDLEQDMTLDVLPFPEVERDTPHTVALRSAIKAKSVVDIQYHSLKDKMSQRTIWPLGVFFWGHVWTLVAWCCLRQAFRMFRMDRVLAIEVKTQTFDTSEHIYLDAYLKEVKAEHECALSTAKPPK